MSNIINTEFTFAEKPISYEIFDNGYAIYLDGNNWIKQLEPYIPNKELSYEENALAQINDIIAPAEDPEEEPEVTIESRVADLESALNNDKAKIDEHDVQITQCEEALAEVYELIIGV